MGYDYIDNKKTVLSGSAYSASKALVNYYVRFILSKQVGKNQSVFSMCPGWCRTDMGGKFATRSPE
jgi:NAD(P)-dependent dehydrogenase (short-subunit alcohol dehydrogenase family)